MKSYFKLTLSFIVFLGIASFLTLEFYFKMPPCTLCKLQRIPYYLSGILCIFSLLFPKIFTEKLLANFVFLLFLIAFFIAGFHIFVEDKLLVFSCNSEIIANNVDELQQALLQKKPECSSKAYIFGARITILSLSFNVFILLFISIKTTFSKILKKKLAN